MISHDAPVLQALLHDGAVLCTLIGVEGGFSRAVGAQIVVRANGVLTGDMTGGCLESALVSEARLARESGENRIVRYGKGSRYIDIQLPCGGGVELYIDAQPHKAVVRAVLDGLDKRESTSYSFGLGVQSDWSLSASSDRFTVQSYPALRILTFGSGPECAAFAALAETWGCKCDVMTPKGQGEEGGLTLGRAPDMGDIDPWTAVVLLFHDHEWEDAILTWALKSSAFYVGALGGQKAVERRIEALRAAGVCDDDLSRLRGPIGLIPFAKDSQMLAISILSEIAQDYGRLTGRLA